MTAAASLMFNSANTSIRGIVAEWDAGLSASYPGTGQTFSNLVTSPADGSAQTAYDLYLGSGSGVDGAEPVFHGSAGGDTAAEYFAGTSSCYFQIPTNTTFINNMHKNNALFSVYGFVKVTSTSDLQLITAVSIPQATFSWDSSSNILGLNVYNASGVVLTAHSTFTVASGTSFLMGCAIDEAAGTVLLYAKDSAGTKQKEALTGKTYTSPASTNGGAFEMFGSTDTSAKIWRAGVSNVALTEQEFDGIWTAYHARKLA